MAEVFRYEVIPSSSWAYLSTILMVSIYFKFNRIISVRNLDILMLAFLTPGLLIVQYGANSRQQLETEIQRQGVMLHHQSEKSESTRPQQDQINGAVPLIDNDVKPKDLQERGLEESSDEDHPTELELKVLNTKNRISVLNGQVEQIVDFQFYGYWWLFSVGGLLMVRMLIDPFMIRRPLLEPNLEFSGLTFLTVVLLVFLIVNVISAKVTQEDIRAAESGKNLATAKAETPSNSKGPGYSLLFLFPVIPTFVANDFVANDQEELKNTVEQSGAPSLTTVTKLVAIFGQLIIVVGIYLVGYLHFNNTRMGIGIVTLYLLLPYTAEMTGRIIHILPAAAMVWAVVCYRKPLWSGLFIGLAMGLAYYPLFLLPLWISFYWHKGLRPFLYGYLVMVGILAITLIFTSSSLGHFGQNLRAMFGLWTPLMEGLQGFWESGNLDPSFRTPVIAAFFCLSISFAVWPAQKNLGTLLSCSAALMVAVQFWNGFGGGILMAWYLPLALMTMFRSNLEDRTAISLSLEK